MAAGGIFTGEDIKLNPLRKICKSLTVRLECRDVLSEMILMKREDGGEISDKMSLSMYEHL